MAKFRKPFDPKALDITPRDDGGPVNAMSLRDWFAGKAPLAINDYAHYSDYAKACYLVADAMLAERRR